MRFLAAISVLVLFAACSGDSDRAGVEKSFELFQQGLTDADGAMLWTVIDDSTRAYFDEFAKSIRDTCRMIQENYPSDERGRALRAVGGDILASARDGQSLFRFMLDPRKLVPPADQNSAKILDVEFSGKSATVITKSGETVTFAKNRDGTWGTRMFLTAFKELPATVSLRDNITICHDNCRLLGIDVDKYIGGT